jgi:hypothetical protein
LGRHATKASQHSRGRGSRTTVDRDPGISPRRLGDPGDEGRPGTERAVELPLASAGSSGGPGLDRALQAHGPGPDAGYGRLGGQVTSGRPGLAPHHLGVSDPSEKWAIDHNGARLASPSIAPSSVSTRPSRSDHTAKLQIGHVPDDPLAPLQNFRRDSEIAGRSFASSTNLSKHQLKIEFYRIDESAAKT